MARFVREGEWLDEEGWSRWIQPVEQGYKMACCDCGLVHTMEFRIEGGSAQFRAKRNSRSTGQMRRHMLDGDEASLVLHKRKKR